MKKSDYQNLYRDVNKFVNNPNENDLLTSIPWEDETSIPKSNIVYEMADAILDIFQNRYCATPCHCDTGYKISLRKNDHISEYELFDKITKFVKDNDFNNKMHVFGLFYRENERMVKRDEVELINGRLEYNDFINDRSKFDCSRIAFCYKNLWWTDLIDPKIKIQDGHIVIKDFKWFGDTIHFLDTVAEKSPRHPGHPAMNILVKQLRKKE
jgi:hypothetical protein